MDHPPAYEAYANQPRPQYNWNTPNNSWVGIWGYDFADLIGKALVDKSKDIHYEVWQFDTNADKVYSAELAERLVHRNFPTSQKINFSGLKPTYFFHSPLILEYARKLNCHSSVFIIPSTLITPFRDSLIKTMSQSKIVYCNFLNTGLLLPQTAYSYNPLRLLHRYLISKKKKTQSG